MNIRDENQLADDWARDYEGPGYGKDLLNRRVTVHISLARLVPSQRVLRFLTPNPLILHTLNCVTKH